MRWIVVVAVPSSVLAAACLFPGLSQLSDGGQAVDACVSCSDAAADARSDGSDAAASFCATLSPTPAFCEDFDKGGYAAQFTNSTTSVDGVLGADGLAFTSPPNSLFSKVGTKASNGEWAYLTRTFTGTAKQVSYAFDLRLDAWGGGESGVMAGILLDEGTPNEHRLVLYVRSGKTALEELFTKPDGGAVVTSDHALAWAPKLGTWAHVVFSIDPAAKTCAAAIDGNADLTATAMDPSWTPGAPSIEVGFSYIASNTSAWTARFDNVVVDWK